MRPARALRLGALALLLAVPAAAAAGAAAAPDEPWMDASAAQEYRPSVWPSAAAALVFLGAFAAAAYFLAARARVPALAPGDLPLRELGAIHLSGGQRLTVVRFLDKVLLLSAAGPAATVVCEMPVKDWPKSSEPAPPPPDPWDAVRVACARLSAVMRKP